MNKMEFHDWATKKLQHPPDSEEVYKVYYYSII